MYTFLATFNNMDGGDDHKLTIEVDLNCIDFEDLDGMNPDQYAWIKAIKCAMVYLDVHKDVALSLGTIEFISC